MNVVFMGTPEFAVEALSSILKSGHKVTAVFTQTDKPQGRKMVMTPPPVKLFALERDIPVYQPTTLKDLQVFETIRQINPDVIVVVAYGKMLPENILKYPKRGCINVHASLLPRHRGASPIQWSIVCGDHKTGVTTMMMDVGMDTGDMLLKSETEIRPEDTADTLHDRLKVMGAQLISETLSRIENEGITPIKQSENEATYAPIIKREMGEIDFSKTAQEINNLVRGFYPWPAAYIKTADGKRLKVFSVSVSGYTELAAATVVENEGRLVVACGGNTSVELLEVQPEGKNRMTAQSLLNGYKIEKGSKICE